MRGSGDENDFLLKRYVKQVADHKESRAEYGLLQSHLQEQKDVQGKNLSLNGQSRVQRSYGYIFLLNCDILIRHNNKNLFIAECKFWKGEKGLIETINQLFGYLTWRDTKTAILIFNKNKNFTSVLEKIRSTLPTHDYHKRIHSLKSQDLQLETIFSYVFHFPNDLERDVYITILTFDLSE